MGQSENIKLRRYEKLQFCLDIPIKCGDIAGEILLNAAIEAEQTFKYIGP